MKIVSVFEQPVERSQEGILPESLATLYDGNLSFPPVAAGRPVIIGNFVESLDGIVSLKIPHQSDGSMISGCNEEDRFIMALLRACADAVMVATRTLHESSGASLDTGVYLSHCGKPVRAASSEPRKNIATPTYCDRELIRAHQSGRTEM
jgi:hypothetical protein